MLAQTMESTGIVFVKTEKGREEMAKRSHGLNPAQRRVLIIIDGSKGVDALADMVPAMVPSGLLREILDYLLEHGFIVALQGDQKAQSHSGKLGVGAASASRAAPNPAQAPIQVPVLAAAPVQTPAPAPAMASVSDALAKPAVAAAAASSVLTDDPATIRLVKDFMTTTAQTYLGLLSAPLIQRIELARTAPQLMSVAGQWNMALRDSSQGKRFADPYLEQVRAALATGARPALEMDT